MPKITKAEVEPNPVGLGQAGEIQLVSVPTKDGSLSGSVEISESNDVFFVSGAKKLQVDPNGPTPFRLERLPAPGLNSPLAVVFFIAVEETGVASKSKRERLVDIAG